MEEGRRGNRSWSAVAKQDPNTWRRAIDFSGLTSDR